MTFVVIVIITIIIVIIVVIVVIYIIAKAVIDDDGKKSNKVKERYFVLQFYCFVFLIVFKEWNDIVANIVLLYEFKNCYFILCEIEFTEIPPTIKWKARQDAKRAFFGLHNLSF